MTASREPSNQSFEVDREATVCSASRRFFLNLRLVSGMARNGHGYAPPRLHFANQHIRTIPLTGATRLTFGAGFLNNFLKRRRVRRVPA